MSTLIVPSLIGITLAVLASGARTPDVAIDLAVAREYFHEARVLGEEDAGRLWGIPVHGPMVFADLATRAAVANTADVGGLFKPEGGVFVGAIPEDVNIANTAVTLGGSEYTMVMWPLPEARYARARLMMHECFHRIQDDLGHPAANPGNAHLDTLDGRIWLQMEWRALAEALIRSGSERHKATEDALVFRARRRAAFGPEAAREEAAIEFNEGLSEYTGYRLCGLPEAVLPDRVAIRLGDQQSQGGFTRNFAYVSGPAYGLLLDAADPAWRRAIKSTDDLGHLLGAAIGFKAPPDVTSEAARRIGRYDGDRLMARETVRDRQRRERLAAYQQRFVEGRVLVLPLSGEVSYSYDPNGLEAIDEASSIYESLRVIDAWGVLEVTGGAWLRRESGRVADVRVSAPSDAGANPVAGDGWTLRLGEGWRLIAGARVGDLTVGK
jgi:hypothetical protein